MKSIIIGILLSPIIIAFIHFTIYPEERTLLDIMFEFDEEDIETGDRIMKINRIISILGLILIAILILVPVFE